MYCKRIFHKTLHDNVFDHKGPIAYYVPWRGGGFPKNPRVWNCTPLNKCQRKTIPPFQLEIEKCTPPPLKMHSLAKLL